MLFLPLVLAGLLSWFGWFALAPAIGLPDISPAGVINTVISDGADPTAPAGWILTALGLMIATTIYVVAARRSAFKPGLSSGLLYGAALWLFVGVVLMPLLQIVAGPDFASGMSSAPAMMPLEPSFMMAGRGLLAPLEALVGWLVFGAVVGIGAQVKEGTFSLPTLNKRVAAVVAGAALLATTAAGFADPARSRSFEVWVIDQVGTGTLYIYPGAALIEGEGEPEVLDLAEAASGVGDGAGEKPHMIDFNTERSHAFIANAASGHVYVMRISDREIIASIDVGHEVHDVTPSPDGRIALVSKPMDKKLGVIETDYETETFTYRRRDDLDLGAREGKRFPDSQPVCALFPRDDAIAYVTLKGGGMYVVNAAGTKPRVIRAYGAGKVTASGCGGTSKDDKLYLGWGSESLSRFYVFDVNDHSLETSIPVDAYGADAHGMTFAGGPRYVWQAVRGAESILIIDTEQESVVGTLGGFGLLPDMPVVSPTGEYVFLTLRGRGFFPLATEDTKKHVGDDAIYDAPPGVVKRTTPGIVVFEVTAGGASGVQKAFIPMPPGPSGAHADPHAVAVLVGP